MELRKITNRVFYTMFSKEADRPVLGYINGREHSLMIDAGNSRNHLRLFNQAVEQEGFRKPDMVAITHWHWDHTFAMHAVEGVTIAHNKTNLKLAEMENWSWSDSDMKNRLDAGMEIEFADTCIRQEYKLLSDIKVTTSTISFSGYMEIDLGDIVAQLHHIPSPHSDDSVCIFVPQEKVLFIGDAVGVDYYNDCYLNKEKLRSMMVVIDGFQFDTCVVGHAEPVSKQKIMSVMDSLLKR